MAGSELKIIVGDLDAGGKRFAFPLRAAWIRGILEDHEATATDKDGLLDVRASKSGSDVVVHGTLRAELTVPCARCLAPVPLTIDETLSLLFVPGKTGLPPVSAKGGAPKKKDAAAPAIHEKAHEKGHGKGKSKRQERDEELELSPEDADTLTYDGETVVLDDVVRDELILETPIFPLCSEDCPGMSPPPSHHKTDKTDEAAKADVATPDTDVDPRLLPLLRLKTKRD